MPNSGLCPHCSLSLLSILSAIFVIIEESSSLPHGTGQNGQESSASVTPSFLDCQQFEPTYLLSQPGLRGVRVLAFVIWFSHFSNPYSRSWIFCVCCSSVLSGVANISTVFHQSADKWGEHANK